jgi:hypothetical protein
LSYQEAITFPPKGGDPHERRDSNPQPVVLETTALPVELRSYVVVSDQKPPVRWSLQAAQLVSFLLAVTAWLRAGTRNGGMPRLQCCTALDVPHRAPFLLCWGSYQQPPQSTQQHPHTVTGHPTDVNTLPRRGGDVNTVPEIFQPFPDLQIEIMDGGVSAAHLRAPVAVRHDPVPDLRITSCTPGETVPADKPLLHVHPLRTTARTERGDQRSQHPRCSKKRHHNDLHCALRAVCTSGLLSCGQLLKPLCGLPRTHT